MDSIMTPPAVEMTYTKTVEMSNPSDLFHLKGLFLHSPCKRPDTTCNITNYANPTSRIWHALGEIDSGGAPYP
ncbi:hypothetical protein Tco_0819462 [Tanacetum coccineum]|uniref:Uncharacterized protein n=1 Tax=Tanacetum coccineum TaxID=301880 RepID=A0ABQ5AAW7_9ASTR